MLKRRRVSERLNRERAEWFADARRVERWLDPDRSTVVRVFFPQASGDKYC